ncbi:Protein F44A2.5 b, partial [Aphelenchoides avenae]
MNGDEKTAAEGGSSDQQPAAAAVGKPRKSGTRPPIQIYVPPGMRNATATTAAAGGTPSPTKANGTPSVKSSDSRDPDQMSNASSESRSSQGDHHRMRQQYNHRRNTDLSQRSNGHSSFPAPRFSKTRSQASSDDSASNGLSPRKEPAAPAMPLIRPPVAVQKDAKNKQFTPKDADEIAQSLRKLNLTKEVSTIEEFLAGKMENDAHARALGSILVQHAIEENKQNGRAVARLCAALLECPSGPAFHAGVVTSVAQYFDCREQLRAGHLRLWIAFLSFVSDLYANIGFTYEGELVEVIFGVFQFLLRSPVLETLKIEE